MTPKADRQHYSGHQRAATFGYIDGFNAGLEAAAKIVCPRPHVEEERTCHEIAKKIRAKKLPEEVQYRNGIACVVRKRGAA